MNKFWHGIKLTVVVFFLMVASVAITLWIVRETQGFSSPSSVVTVSNQSTVTGSTRESRWGPICKRAYEGDTMKFTEAHYKMLFVADKLQDLKDSKLVSGGYECSHQAKDLLREGKLQGFEDPTSSEIEEIMAFLQESLTEEPTP